MGNCAGWQLTFCEGRYPVTNSVRILGPDEAAVLDRVADDVFDEPVDARWAGITDFDAK
jgi:hypothetical protein